MNKYALMLITANRMVKTQQIATENSLSSLSMHFTTCTNETVG